ncbi:outer membrane beta-barrel protein [Aureimonas sp. SK2]|uniref:outer membrane beta-barrel protein n=1 Tax=Aureimonas sp. SK2 TaxID=3015992 RepID=UPI0024439810|nr:outer membrane beta-barrel protein [Aureimonas sp. SK2]
MTRSLRPLLASLLLSAGPILPASAQDAFGPPAPPRRGEAEVRLSDTGELRTRPAASYAEPVRQPLDPRTRELSRDLDANLADPSSRPRRERTDAPAERPGAEAAATLDLFAGPPQPRRENLPQSTRQATPAQPVDRGVRPVGATRNRAGAPRVSGLPGVREGQTLPGLPQDEELVPDDTRAVRPEGTLAPPDLFRAVGPIRSPTRDARLGRQGMAGLDDLRRSLPIAADDPFAPIGLRLGSFTAYTTLEQSFGTSDNLTNTLDGSRGAFSETALSARVASNWSRHAAELNALASYRRNDSGPLEEVPRLDLDGRLRLDIDRDWTANLRGALRFDRDDPLVTGPATTANARRDILAYSAGASLTRAVGRLSTDLDLSAVREDRDDGLFDGTVRRLDDSFTTWSAGLRAGYDIAPALRPFVAASVGRRLFDEEALGAPSRDSVIPALRGGLAFDWGEKLSGEVALGYAWNIPDADALEEKASPTIDARIAWSPLRGTDVLLRGETFFEPDTTGLATSTLYQLSLGLRHRATARIDLDGRLIAGLRDGPIAGDENLYAAETGLTYWLNRYVAFTARYRYDRFDSPRPGLDYDANTFRIGVRLQR